MVRLQQQAGGPVPLRADVFQRGGRRLRKPLPPDRHRARPAPLPFPSLPPQSVIILLQTAPSVQSRTYLDFGSKGQAYDAVSTAAGGARANRVRVRTMERTPEGQRCRPRLRPSRRRGGGGR